jgi:hypothetical protein
LRVCIFMSDTATCISCHRIPPILNPPPTHPPTYTHTHTHIHIPTQHRKPGAPEAFQLLVNQYQPSIERDPDGLGAFITLAACGLGLWFLGVYMLCVWGGGITHTHMRTICLD